MEEHSGRSEVEEGDVSGGVLPMKTVSFRPGAAVGRSFRPRAGHQSAPPQRRNIDALEIIDGVEAFDAAFDEFVSAAPPPPPLPEESGLALTLTLNLSLSPSLGLSLSLSLSLTLTLTLTRRAALLRRAAQGCPCCS